MRAAAAGLVLSMVAATAAYADPTPLELYDAGHYDEAIKAGLAQHDADGFSTAAHAELAKERMRPAPCLDCLKRAEAYARQAIAADPKEAAPHIYLAAALGYQAHIIGVMQAKLKGYAEEAKTNIEVALADHPDDPWALAAMGGWHIGVVNGGGSMLASMVYGATMKKGLAYYDKAFKADPGNIPIRFQYALSLSAYDREAYAKQIEAALDFAATGKPRTAYEVFMQGRAVTLLGLFKRGDWDAYDALVKKYQGYPD